jgi:hypothetical protein
MPVMIKAAYAKTILELLPTTNDSGKSSKTTFETPVFSAYTASTT